MKHGSNRQGPRPKGKREKSWRKFCTWNVPSEHSEFQEVTKGMHKITTHKGPLSHLTFESPLSGNLNHMQELNITNLITKIPDYSM